MAPSDSESRLGGGFGAPAYRYHPAVVVQRGRLREQRRDVSVRAEPEQQDVEARRRAVVPGWRGGGELARVPLGGRVEIVAGGAVAGRHRVHPGRVERRRASSSASRAWVSLRSGCPRRQEALVTPPDVQPAPVDRVAGRATGQLAQRRIADAAAGQDDGGLARGPPGRPPRPVMSRAATAWASRVASRWTTTSGVRGHSASASAGSRQTRTRAPGSPRRCTPVALASASA